MPSNKLLLIPLEIAELLHATLGPLGDVLDREGHHWAAMVRRVVGEYTGLRNDHLAKQHGDGVVLDISHETFTAAEKVCQLTESAMAEAEDFLRWREEVEG